MDGRDKHCDVCQGTEFEPYLDGGESGRTLARCRDCGLVVAMAPAVDAALRDGSQRDKRTDLRRAAAISKVVPAGRVLEVGCGEGHVLSALDPARYEVVGVETAEPSAASACRRITEAGLRGSVLPCALAAAGLPAETFDLVAMFGSLARSVSPRSTLGEVARLLRPGGYAVIETPGLTSLTALLLGARWRPLHDPRSWYFFSASSLERLTSTCGLSPGSTWLPMPVGWPAPGTLVYVARKSAVMHRAGSLTDLATQVGKIAPIGAAH